MSAFSEPLRRIYPGKPGCEVIEVGVDPDTTSLVEVRLLSSDCSEVLRRVCFTVEQAELVADAVAEVANWLRSGSR